MKRSALGLTVLLAALLVVCSSGAALAQSDTASPPEGDETGAAQAQGDTAPPSEGDETDLGTIDLLAPVDPLQPHPEYPWTVGVSADWYWVSGYATSRGSGSDKDVDFDGTLWGGTVTLGYDKFFLSARYREGNFDRDRTTDDGVDIEADIDREEVYLGLNWTLTEAGKPFQSRFGFGYWEVDTEWDYLITTPGWIWTATGEPTGTREETIRGLYLDVGFSWHLDDAGHFGLGGDLMGGAGIVDRSGNMGGDEPDSAWRGQATLALSYKPFLENRYLEGLTLQGGVRGEALYRHYGEEAQGAETFEGYMGVFASVMYVIRF